jgi:short-subunit dehydrogenase
MQTSSQRPLAVVTGGTSALGRELARQCIAHGYDVVLVAAGAGVHETARQLGADVAAVFSQKHDLSTYDGVESAWREILALGRPIDVLILNFAGAGSDELSEQLRVLRRNCDALVHLSRRALPGMIARRRGRVLVTTTPTATGAFPAAMSAFALSFAGGLRAELAEGGVSITTVQPREDAPVIVARQAFAGMLRGKANLYAGSWTRRLRAWLFPEPRVANARLLRAPGP